MLTGLLHEFCCAGIVAGLVIHYGVVVLLVLRSVTVLWLCQVGEVDWVAVPASHYLFVCVHVYVCICVCVLVSCVRMCECSRAVPISGGSAVDGASVFVDLGSSPGSLYSLCSHSSSSNCSGDWQASSYSGAVDGPRCGKHWELVTAIDVSDQMHPRSIMMPRVTQ